jgi:hypothetical protein
MGVEWVKKNYNKPYWFIQTNYKRKKEDAL